MLVYSGSLLYDTSNYSVYTPTRSELDRLRSQGVTIYTDGWREAYLSKLKALRGIELLKSGNDYALSGDITGIDLWYLFDKPVGRLKLTNARGVIPYTPFTMNVINEDTRIYGLNNIHIDVTPTSCATDLDWGDILGWCWNEVPVSWIIYPETAPVVSSKNRAIFLEIFLRDIVLYGIDFSSSYKDSDLPQLIGVLRGYTDVVVSAFVTSIEAVLNDSDIFNIHVSEDVISDVKIMRGKPNRYDYPYYLHFWEDPDDVNEELSKVLRIISWFRGTNSLLDEVRAYIENGVLTAIGEI